MGCNTPVAGLQQQTETKDPNIEQVRTRPRNRAASAATQTLQNQRPTPGTDREGDRRASKRRCTAPAPTVPSGPPLPILQLKVQAETARMEHGWSGEEFQDFPDHNDGTSCYAVSIEDIDNATAVKYNMHEGDTSARSSQFHLTSEESLLPSRGGKKQAKQKNIARRGSAFTKEEDTVLCSAYLDISKDAIVGVNQNTGAYYKRIYDYYSEHKPIGSVLSQIGLQKRLGVIQKAVTKFCAFKSTVDRRNESGKNEYDRIEDVVQMYEKDEPFQFRHCWKILRYEPKWNDRLLEVNSTPPVRKVPAASDPIVNQGADDPIERPEWRDSAKRRKGKEDSASSNACNRYYQSCQGSHVPHFLIKCVATQILKEA